MIRKRLDAVDLNFYALRKTGEYCRRIAVGRPGQVRGRAFAVVPAMAGAGHVESSLLVRK